jgi:hypothetical protein
MAIGAPHTTDSVSVVHPAELRGTRHMLQPFSVSLQLPPPMESIRGAATSLVVFTLAARSPCASRSAVGSVRIFKRAGHP